MNYLLFLLSCGRMGQLTIIVTEREKQNKTKLKNISAITTPDSRKGLKIYTDSRQIHFGETVNNLGLK